MVVGKLHTMNIPLSPLQLTISNAILLGAGGLVISLLIVVYRLGQLNAKLDGLDSVSQLTGQLAMIDISKARSIPNNVSEMRNDLDDVVDEIGKFEGMAKSVDTIERSVTNIDFQGIERAIDQLVDGGLPTGNSVKYTLEEAGIDLVVSLTSADYEETEVSFKFEGNVGTRNLISPITEDDEFAEYEIDKFGREAGLHSVSPREIIGVVPTSDIDAVVDWVSRILELFDENYIELHQSKDEFDSRLEKNLK